MKNEVTYSNSVDIVVFEFSDFCCSNAYRELAMKPLKPHGIDQQLTMGLQFIDINDIILIELDRRVKSRSRTYILIVAILNSHGDGSELGNIGRYARDGESKQID